MILKLRRASEKAFWNMFEFLKASPLIGPTYPRATAGPLREIVFRSYRIFYDVSEKSRLFDILHVWHGSRNDPDLI